MSYVRGFSVEFAQLIAAGLVWVVGSAWNSAFQEYARSQKWLRGMGPFVYAAFLTIAVGVLLYTLKQRKWLQKEA